MALLLTDRDLRIAHLDAEAARRLGVPPSELLGARLADVVGLGAPEVASVEALFEASSDPTLALEGRRDGAPLALVARALTGGRPLLAVTLVPASGAGQAEVSAARASGRAAWLERGGPDALASILHDLRNVMQGVQTLVDLVEALGLEDLGAQVEPLMTRARRMGDRMEALFAELEDEPGLR